jgi:hypothetical protein
MRRVLPCMFAVGLTTIMASMFSEAVIAADAPAARVVVMYFHRTQRCPTCLRMGSYTEEAVKAGFAKELKDGKVEFHYIDFQDQRNAELTNGYSVGGPTLIVARVTGNKVAEYQNLTEIWAKSRDKAAFIDYVQSNIKNYQK